MDAFRMMREAVDNGMEYLVMEVSSQAYKVDRVFGLTFDVAAFLNISPDHISPIEHPTFEDYLHCKRQIVKNCRALVLGADCARADLIRQDARHASVPVTTFALGGDSTADVMAAPANDDHSRFSIVIDGTSIGELSLTLDGDFNYAKCPHCNHSLAHKKDRKHFVVHKCVNPKCPYYLHERGGGRRDRPCGRFRFRFRTGQGRVA